MSGNAWAFKSNLYSRPSVQSEPTYFLLFELQNKEESAAFLIGSPSVWLIWQEHQVWGPRLGLVFLSVTSSSCLHLSG